MNHAPFTLRPHAAARTLVWLLVTFLVLFPKGGLKLGGAPITWGYLLLAAGALPLLFYRLFALPLRAPWTALAALASLLPFQIILVYSYLANGFASLEYLLSLVTNFFALPLLFLFVFPAFFPWINRRHFVRHLCNCIFWAAAYGIFLFFWRPITGHLIEVPFLTVNIADYGKIELTKHIARGSFLKLISTYNNGNVYGVATLILLPLYTLLEPSKARRYTVRFALLLTLSRTVWAGLVVEQLLGFLRPLFANLFTFPRLHLRGAAKPLLLLGATAVSILAALFASSYSLSFLFDPTLGGRIGEISGLSSSTVLPSIPVTGFAEVLFAAALINYGYVGMIAVILIFTLPILLLLARPSLIRTPAQKAAFKGLVLYVIVSASDGATNLIPVLAFYWFVYSVMLYDLPGRPAAVPVPVPELPSAALWHGSRTPAPARVVP